MNVGARIQADGYAITDASLLDIFAVWRVERQCFPKDAYDMFTLLSMALSANLVRLKVVADGHVIGYAAGEVRQWERVGWVITLGVAPKYWGRGIGGHLLAAIEGATQPMVERVKLTVRQSNARAIALYQRNGYRQTSVLRRYYHDGEDGLVMEKHV